MTLLALAIACSGDVPTQDPVVLDEAPAQPKNVLLITLDTTRADYLSTYGYAAGATPNLDGIGTRFDLGIASAAVTPVAHATVLTGRANHEHGLRVISASEGFALPAGTPTMATVLQAAGYHTAAVHSAFPVSSHFGLDAGFDVFDDLDATMTTTGAGHTTWDLKRFQRRSDETTQRALTVLDQLEEPWLLWVHYWDPHDAALLPEPEFQPPAVSESERRPIYAAEVQYMDRSIGPLLERTEGALVAVVADHGQGLGDHDWEKHRVLYQEQIRVPYLLGVPGLDAPASVPDLVRTSDILPTVLEWAGVEEPEGTSGRSVLGLMRGEREPGRVALADQLNGYDLNAALAAKRPQAGFLYVAMDRDWKLIWRPEFPDQSELFDLRADPAELEDLYEPDHPEALRLLGVLADEAPWVSEPWPTAEEDDDVTAALAALGYTTLEGVGRNPTWTWICPDRGDDCEAKVLVAAP